MKTLETERLILRPFVLEDIDDFFEYCQMKTVGPKAGWAVHENKEFSRKIIEGFIEKKDVLAVLHKRDNKVIGSVGLHKKTDKLGNIQYEIGYVLSTPYEGKGLMTEAVKRVIKHAFIDLHLDEIYVCHFLKNDKSRRVIEKCNFKYIKNTKYQTLNFGLKESKVYSLKRVDYIKLKEINMNTWDLTKLYNGFEDEAFLEDQKKLDKLVETYVNKEQDFKNYDNKLETLLEYFNARIELTELFIKLMSFSSLVAACESTNIQAMKSMNSIQMKFAKLAKIETLFSQWLLRYPNIDEDIQNSSFLKEHEFIIKEIIAEASHLLDDKTESLLARLAPTGSGSWGRLQSLLTSTLSVDYDGKQITLSEVRNLASSPDGKVRKAAYEAELEAYKKIEKSVAFSLNSIKGEVNTISQERGFESPLAQALFNSRMKQETLDVMQEACLEYMDIFRLYLKRKAKLLGHKNGLPFYDLFAPIGATNTTFTIPEANEYIMKNFRTFSEELYLMAKKAFTNNWIDYSPRPGKVGGAFCSNIYPIKESRVLSNFTGAFGDMITLSHELGHAFHGEQIFKVSPLNSQYTMPVAETASTFCETIVNKAALKDAANDEERIFLLESSIQDYTQVVVDIMSRFLFEKAVFDGRLETVFDENELKNIMIKAQKDTYGDGLDPEYLHPYMWVCKSHYYRGGLSYYNFPYTFGLLFAKGLYAKYLKNKDEFVVLYNKLLSSTGQMMVEDAAMIAGIDVTKKDFWVGSLELLKEDIEMFLKLTK